MASYINPNYTTNDETKEDAEVVDTDSIEKTQEVLQKGK